MGRYFNNCCPIIVEIVDNLLVKIELTVLIVLYHEFIKKGLFSPCINY